jgi:DNA-3-methyladenine glycosylase I
MSGAGRCEWCGSDPLYVAYHDTEWGVPERDGRALWEKLILDGFQAGLSWITILRKRDAFREAFDGFEPEVIAHWGEADVARLLADPGIVRHRGKIEATIGMRGPISRSSGRAGSRTSSGAMSTGFRFRTVGCRRPMCLRKQR